MLGIGLLPENQFWINERGVATVVPHALQAVCGVVWELSKTQVEMLDRCEGVEKGCYHQQMLCVQMDDESVECLVYVDSNRGRGRPRLGYLEKVIAAAHRFRFPEKYVEELCTWTRQ